MQSKASTADEYMKGLPEDRRGAIDAVRAFVNRTVEPDIQEGMQYGMICWTIPHRIYPQGYHVDPRIPLPYLALASQKQYMSLYIMQAYMEGDEEGWFRREWAKTGKKLDMGKSCLRFKKLDDLSFDVLEAAIKRSPIKTHIAHYEAGMSNLSKMKRSKPAKNATARAKSAPAKKAKSTAKPVAKRAAPSRGKAAATKR